jgi:hypothetical protein
MNILKILQKQNYGSKTMFFRNKFLTPKKIIDKMEESILNLKKKKLLFRGFMLKKQIYKISIPLTYKNNTTILKFEIPTFTFSELAGHGSFLFLAFSYLGSDFLHLRLFAISGISLAILFQYYREKPLWIPIRWNILFLLINGVMVLLVFS